MIVISLKMTIHVIFFLRLNRRSSRVSFLGELLCPRLESHTQSEKQPTKTVLTDNASLHLLLHCALQLCQGHVQLGFVHVIWKQLHLSRTDCLSTERKMPIFFFLLSFFFFIKQIATMVKILCRQFFPQCHDRHITWSVYIQQIQQALMEIDFRVLSINNQTLFESELCNAQSNHACSGRTLCKCCLPNDSTKLDE